MKSPEEIRQIIEDEIAKNSSIGFIKDDLLFMNVARKGLDKRNKGDKLADFMGTGDRLIDIFLISFLIFFLSFISLSIVFEKFSYSYICQTILYSYLIIWIIYFSLFCFIKTFLVYDIKDGYFYNLSYIFGNLLSFLTTEKIDAKNIELVILETFASKGQHGNHIWDNILVLINNNELYLTGSTDYKDYHNLLIERCCLLTKCLGVNLKYRSRGDLDLIPSNNYIPKF